MSSQAKLQATRLRYLCLLVGGLVMAPALAAPPIGAQVIVQAFDPRNPDAQNIQTPYDSGSAVSDVVIGVWGELRNFVCGPLKQHMGRGDLLAKGITLRDIECTMPDGELIATQNGQRGLKLAYRVKGVSFAATSTTPTVLGDYADPRFSVTFDLDFELGLALQESGDVLRVSAAKVVVSNADIGPRNFVGKVLKWFDDNLAPILMGQSFRGQAEAALNGFNPDFANKVNAALAPVNNALRPPQNLIRSGLWARPGKIYIAFAPAEWVPPANSQVSGRVSWKNTDVKFSADSCAAFPMSARVQTGPAPLTDPVTRATGPAPTRQVGQVVSVSPVTAMGDNRECGYTLGALPGGVPVGIGAGAPNPKPKYGSSNTFSFPTRLIAKGWGGRTVPDGGSGRDWEIAQGRDISVPVHVEALVPRQKSIDPVINQAINPALNPAINPAINPAFSTGRKLESKTLQTPAAAQMLNPQPLPPKSKLMPAAASVLSQPAASQGIVSQPGAAESATATQLKTAPLLQKQLAQ
jgi:hypothetical protein